jgi:NADH-quinone oxidoreductase subunit L
MLAYSTVSQVGYMFLALGVGAWTAAIFHFMTHAFFKALLFLSAGIVIEALHHDHDIFHMGGLRRTLPVAFWTFLAGGCALAGLPLITAGAISKDLILWSAWTLPAGSPELWAVGIAGVVLTSLYTFRVVFLVFFGETRSEVNYRPGLAIQIPVWILAALSILAGFIESGFTGFANLALPMPTALPRGSLTQAGSTLTAGLAFFVGLLLAWFIYLRPAARETAGPGESVIERFWLAGWGFDWLYERLFVRPVVWLAGINKGDVVDSLYNGIAKISELAYRALSHTQTGRIRWYAAGIAAGAVLFVAIAIFL